MSGRRVHVAAPSRLHFGMLSFGRPGVRQFGGLGAMVAAPGVRLTVSASDRLEARGPLSERVIEYARCVARAPWFRREPRCRIDVSTVPRQHIGLGTGTQLGLAVAAGLNAFYGGSLVEPVELARSVGRGARSAIGIHGFARGGLLLEAGKRAADEISPLVARIELPTAWRFVLLSPTGEQGLSGDAEHRVFDALPPVPDDTTAALCREVLMDVLPAAAAGEFEGVSEGLYRYGRIAGRCFAAHQGGTYAGPGPRRLVERIRALGVRGVGQTSWGPTVFALFPGETAARDFLARLDGAETRELELVVAAPDNWGARFEVLSG